MQDDFDIVDLTLKNKLQVITRISDKLVALGQRGERIREILDETRFGPWFDLTNPVGDPMLVHMWLQLEVDTADANVNEEMTFRLLGHNLQFGPHEFCLITGLPFGSPPRLPELPSESFVDRVFPGVGPTNIDFAVMAKEILETNFAAISDDDAARVILVLMVEFCFMGRESWQVASQTVLQAVEDLAIFNSYPWGSYIWTYSFRQMHRAVLRRKGDKRGKMNLVGFAYALKVTIIT